MIASFQEKDPIKPRFLDISEYKQCLRNAVSAWKKFSYSDDENYREYSTFKKTKYTTSLWELLGKELLTQPLNILDVGCGSGITSHFIIGKANVNKYHSIDLKYNNSSFLKDQWCQIRDCKHFCRDVFVDDLTHDLEIGEYHIVIIDIEPHGKEIEVYEKIKVYMHSAHLCILTCIGEIDLYAGYFGDIFLGHYRDKGKLRDFFAETSLSSGYRDIFAVMCLFSGPLDAKCQELATGQVIKCCDQKIPRIVLHNDYCKTMHIKKTFPYTWTQPRIIYVGVIITLTIYAFWGYFSPSFI